MSWGVALRNAVGLGLGGIPSLRKSGPYPKISFDFTKGTLDPLITFTRASSATYFDSAGVLQTAANDVARFDYNPSTLAARGLLIEEARTNRHTYSEDLTQWGTPSGATVSANAAVAPDGATTADKLVESATNAAHFLSASSITMSYTSGTSYTRSCFAKAAGRNIITVYLPATNFVSNGRQALFDLSNGTVYSSETGVTASIQAINNGWYRCSVTAAANATGTGHVGGSALTDNGTGTYLGDGTSGALIWGAQTEAGAFATSYIPTTTTVLTRSADVAAITGTNFTNWFNSIEGTMVVSATVTSTTVDGTTRVLASIGDSSTFNETIYLARASSSANITGNVIDGGVAQWAANTLGSATVNTPFKTSMAYKLNDLGGSFNGAAAVTDNVATIPTVNSLSLGNGSWSGAVNYINGYLQSFSYYPTRLRNGTLQALTS